MTLEIQLMAWKEHKNVAVLNSIVGRTQNVTLPIKIQKGREKRMYTQVLWKGQEFLLYYWNNCVNYSGLYLNFKLI
jgi:hypothetical protein